MKNIVTRNPVRRALAEGKPSLGTWIQLGHPGVAEILANAGYDWIAADCEHTEIGIAEFAALARGMYGRGPLPLVRVRENDTLAIRQALDLGAMGVIVPLVNSAAEAERAVAAAKYPPRGVRGSAYVRANGYGRGFQDYSANANQDTLVMVMIESRQAVADIDAILAVDGVDGTFIGPVDLSASYGVPGQVDHPLVQEARRAVNAACAHAGKAPGLHLVAPTQAGIRSALDEGFTFIALGMDTVFLDQGAREALKLARSAVAAGA